MRHDRTALPASSRHLATRWQVYNAVAGDLPPDAASIARLTGLARSTVSRKLHALVDRGLVVRDPDTGRYQQGEVEPSEAAGTGAGKHRRDQDRYAHERAAYHRRDSRDH